MDSFSVEAPSYRDFTAGSSQEDVDYFGKYTLYNTYGLLFCYINSI